MSETIIRRERRTRKARCCFLCGEDVAPGERYVHNVILGRDGAYDWDVHLHCDAIVERYLMAFGKEEYDRDNVEEWARDEICSECDELQTTCECSPLSCPRALRSLLPPSLQTHEDIRKHLEAKEAGYEKY